MTISPENIKVGDTLYRVSEIHNWISSRSSKIKMVDDDGVEWFRYEKPKIEYVIETWEVVGKVTPLIEGEVDWSDYATDIMFRNCKTSEIVTESITVNDKCERYYTDVGDAESDRQDKQTTHDAI